MKTLFALLNSMPAECFTAVPRQSASAKKRQFKAKLAAQPPAGARSAFREVEKIYLSRNPPPDYGAVVDLSCPHLLPDIEAHALESSLLGLLETSNDPIDLEKLIYTFSRYPGLLVIPNAIPPAAQRQLIKNCMRNTSRQPNLNNLDSHYLLPEEGLWYHFERSRKTPELEHEDVLVDTIAQKEQTTSARTRPECSRRLITDPAVDSETPIGILRAAKEQPVPSDSVKPEKASQLLFKLRWTNLGLMYHWTTKSYQLEEVFNRGSEAIVPMPGDLASLSKSILRAIPQYLIPLNQDWSDFKPESGIVNFYQLKNTLMGHIDQSELVKDQPLVSFSFGHSAVFLIGGTTRDEKPMALFLRSGDAMIMSGSCRRAYHGVPRIIEGTLPSYLDEIDKWDAEDQTKATKEDRDDWKIFAEYLRTTRINVNIRQVFPEGYLDRLSL